MRKYLLFFLGGLIIVGGAGWLFLTNQTSLSPLSQEEKTKALTKLLGRTPILEEKKTSDAWISHENSYVSFLYPEIAKVYTDENQKVMQQSGVLDSFYFGTDTPKVYVVVQVLNRPQEENFSEEPAVLMREQQQNGYLQSLVSIDSATFQVFEKEGDTVEKSAFLLHGGKVYSIVVTGGNKENVSDFFDRLTASFRVKE